MNDDQFESMISFINRGDKQGLRKIYDEYGKMIYSVMLSVVKNPHDAEDLTSDFFVKLWEKLAAAYKKGNGHKAWMVTAARNMAIDHLRKSGREELVLDISDDEEYHINEPISESNTEEETLGKLSLKEALEKLNPAEREIINLKIFAMMTFEEIAVAVHKPMGTVTWRYRNGLKKLERYLKEVQNCE